MARRTLVQAARLRIASGPPLEEAAATVCTLSERGAQDVLRGLPE
jgi:hypothetical protein